MRNYVLSSGKSRNTTLVKSMGGIFSGLALCPPPGLGASLQAESWWEAKSGHVSPHLSTAQVVAHDPGSDTFKTWNEEVGLPQAGTRGTFSGGQRNDITWLCHHVMAVTSRDGSDITWLGQQLSGTMTVAAVAHS